jgi:hypothetical protein
MSEAKFVHELRKSIEHYARANGVGPAPTWKLRGDAILSSLPDILGVYWHTTFFMECKVREKPKRKFDLMVGLTPSQRATLRAITVAGGHAFLAVRIGNNLATITNFKKIWRIEKKFPNKIISEPYKILIDYNTFNPYFEIIQRKPHGLWENIGRVIYDE